MTGTDSVQAPQGVRLHDYLRCLAQREGLNHVLEVGSSTGDEGVEAFASERGPGERQTILHCIEISSERVAHLSRRFSNHPRLKVYHASSVPRGDFISERDLRRLYVTTVCRFNQQPLGRVIERLEDELKRIKDSRISESGIEMVKTDNRIAGFEIAIIDGSSFSALANISRVLGSDTIIVTSVNDLLGLKAYEQLKQDPNYLVESEYWGDGTTYAAFARRKLVPQAQLPVHFFTIVLNGMPFLKHHIDVLSQLSVPWTWHIIEGVASLSHDTAWSLQNGARINDSLHRNGLSHDGTTEYLDTLSRQYPDRVKIYRKPSGEFWSGKREMVNAPLSSITEQALLVQIDSDELWTVEQLERLAKAFQQHPDKTAAFFFCHYFVGPEIVIATRNTYGNNSSYEWLRAWRFFPGSRWEAHEPPRLMAPLSDGRMIDLAHINPFTHSETESMGLVFQHYAYVTEEQARFKESYYGYIEAVSHWHNLQQCAGFPVLLSSYLPWVKDAAQVVPAATMGVVPLARKTLGGVWHMTSRAASTSSVREVLLVRTDLIGDAVLFSSLLPGIRELYPDSKISIICQDIVAPIWEQNPLIHRVIPFRKTIVQGDQRELESFVTQLRDLKPDVAINSAWSADALAHVLTLSSGAPIRICFTGDSANIHPSEKERALALYSVVAESSSQATLEINRYRDLLSAMGSQVESISSTYLPTVTEREDARVRIHDLGLSTERLLIVVPQAAGGIPHREYPRIVQVVPEIARRQGLDVLVLGTAKDAAIADAIVRAVGTRACSMAGKTSIREAAALISQASCALGVDTGLMHLAAAQDVPSVVIMGGGHFGRFFPHGARTKVVTNRLECFGCNWVCTLSEPLCTSGIVPRAVVDEVCSLCSECGIDARPRVMEQRVASALSLLEA